MDASPSAEPPRRLPGELGFGLALLLFSLTALWQSYKISGFSSLSSAGAMPLGTSFVMSVCAAMIVWSARRKPVAAASAGDPLWRRFFRQIMPPQVIVFTALIVFYMLALERLGFIVSSFVYLVLTNFALGQRRVFYTLGINLILLASIYLVFQVAFSVVLPEGVVERLWR